MRDHIVAEVRKVATGVQGVVQFLLLCDGQSPEFIIFSHFRSILNDCIFVETCVSTQFVIFLDPLSQQQTTSVLARLLTCFHAHINIATKRRLVRLPGPSEDRKEVDEPVQRVVFQVNQIPVCFIIFLLQFPHILQRCFVVLP